MIAIYQVLNRGLPDLIMTVFVVYILHRLHPFHVPLCNLMFLMMLYNNLLFVSNVRHEWYVKINVRTPLFFVGIWFLSLSGGCLCHCSLYIHVTTQGIYVVIQRCLCHYS